MSGVSLPGIPARGISARAISARGALSRGTHNKIIPVTADNFIRAEFDLFFGQVVREGGFGKFQHQRWLVEAEDQTVTRPNRDMLQSRAVFDLNAGPVTITLPDAGHRFLSLQIFDEDEYVLDVAYGGGSHSYSREWAGTRYILAVVRIFADPRNPADFRDVPALQDGLGVQQQTIGNFEVPSWDPGSQSKIRQALLALADTVPDTRAMFGSRDRVDPIRHLIGAASAWGGNPERDALYLKVTPRLNDGLLIHRLSVKNVPVEAFWSITVYNARGYLEPNGEGVYSVNSITALKASDGTVNVQFGGNRERNPNCLPIMPGWNYVVRLYRPHSLILNGKWRFPEASPVQ